MTIQHLRKIIAEEIHEITKAERVYGGVGMKAVPPYQVDVSKSKVKRFFDHLERSQLRNYLNFTSPQEQYEAIRKFAEMVGVPKSKIGPLISSLRDL